ncbi:Uma2 family endonuclease [Salinibacter ruber]|uniref:Uma2 family endonuclease n=1 Tax=Salinibacter ruber TaxID=146919 RepID=UPI0021699BDF|nr:Uma2 family endonuclease [Salinibacter ruber]MCS4119203.1 Uma2 family endonuclease [Salinibacter ruber]MCS4187628.1 Uma2 family endonuclease [Salinibacter ruber]
MPTTTAPAKEHQKRWQEIIADPNLRELPYKVETNTRGQIVLSPHRPDHSYAQGDVIELLYEHAEEGRPFPEFPITTEAGVRVPDVVWVTPGRREEMDKAGDPPTLAPEICVEVMSENNDWDEMDRKRGLYREAGAEEVWVVAEDGEVRFFGAEEMEESDLVPGFPEQV